MGKTTISVVCADQRLVTVVTPIVASGGQNEDVVRFEFCPLWEGFAKTAVFYRDDSEQYIVALDGDQCVIPSEVLQTEGIVYFGVFGVKDGITRTSEVIQYRVVKGAVTEGTRPADPTPDIYTQIMNHLAAVESRMAPLGAFEHSGNVVQFNNYAGMPVRCVTDIILAQEGSGTPARDNIRAITGWSGAKLTRCRSMEESTAPDAEEFVVEFGQNVYSGSFNWNTGVLTIDKGYVEFRGADGEAWGLGSSPSTFYIDVHGMAKLSDYRASLLSNIYPNVRNQHEFTTSPDAAGLTGYADTAGNYPGQNWIYIRDYAAATVEEFKALLAETPVQIVYPLESPITVGFTPAHITALHGANTIWCDAGPTTVSGRLDLLWPTELLAQRDNGGSSALGKVDAFVVGEGLQMDGDVLGVVPEGEYELIETITLTEDAMINRTAEPDGTPYNYSAMLIRIVVNSGAVTKAGNIIFFANPDDWSSVIAQIWQAEAATNTQASRSELFIERGMWKIEYTTMSSNTGLAYLRTNNIETLDRDIKLYPTIKQLIIQAILPANTLITIWGVRA